MDTFVRIVMIGILLGGIYGLVAMGLNLIFGVIRVLNFAQGELVMISMYGAFFAQQVFGMNIYLTAVLVIPGMFVLGLLIQRFIIRPLSDEPAMQLLATFGLLIFLQSLMLVLTGGDTRTAENSFARETFTILSAKVDVGRLLIFFTTTVVAIVLWWVLKSTAFGRSMRAVTEDRMAAKLMGINVDRTFLYAFGIGSALAGLAGVLLAPVYSITPTVGANFIFAAFAVVVLGGLGSVVGAYVGGLIIGLVEALGGYYLDPSLGTAFYFVVFLIVLVVKPAGLFGRIGSEKIGGH